MRSWIRIQNSYSIQSCIVHLILGGDAPDPGLADADVLEPPCDGLPLAAEHVGPPAHHTAGVSSIINTILGPRSPPHRVLAVHRPHHASRTHTKVDATILNDTTSETT